MIAATITGTVGRDAELRQPRGGDQVLSFNVASRRYANGQESTDWITVSFWGKRAEAIARHVTKGSRIAARGALHVREYEHDGAKRWSIELRADDVELLGAPRGVDDGGAERGPFTRGTDRFSGHTAALAAAPIPPDDFGDYGGGSDDNIPC